MYEFPLPLIRSCLEAGISLDDWVEEKQKPQRYLFWSSPAEALRNSSLLQFLCLIYYTVMYKHLQENIN